MTIRAKQNWTLVVGALATAVALSAPLASNAAGNDGAWDQFHNSHVSTGGTAASASFPGGYGAFHQGQTAAEAASGLQMLPERTVQGAWDNFHYGHTVSKS
jgi:hypothetical protein